MVKAKVSFERGSELLVLLNPVNFCLRTNDLEVADPRKSGFVKQGATTSHYNNQQRIYYGVNVHIT